MPGTVEAIFVAAKPKQTMQSLTIAELVAGSGIRGDRNFRDGIAHDGQVTLIAAEEIERFNRATGLHIGGADTRRNVVTRGVELNQLVGRPFRVGATTLIGVELCEPCSTLGKNLATSAVPVANVVEAFAHRAGLRARIDIGGCVVAGDRVDV